MFIVFISKCYILFKFIFVVKPCLTSSHVDKLVIPARYVITWPSKQSVDIKATRKATPLDLWETKNLPTAQERPHEIRITKEWRYTSRL